jgi:hypothetical protein
MIESRLELTVRCLNVLPRRRAGRPSVHDVRLDDRAGGVLRDVAPIVCWAIVAEPQRLLDKRGLLLANRLRLRRLGRRRRRRRLLLSLQLVGGALGRGVRLVVCVFVR